jgi:multiple sugar transport system permease protein
MLRTLRAPLVEWRGLSRIGRIEATTFYLWIAPWLIGFLIWRAWPMIYSAYLSFTDFRLLNQPRFTGLANLEALLRDTVFLKSVQVTLGYVFGVVPIGTVIALVAALILAQKLRAVSFWRAVYFLPAVISGVAIAVMWGFILNPDFGLLNNLLALVGIQGPSWISSESWALPSIIMIGWWMGIGTQMIIYIAGLKGIPEVLYESAEIDGADGWHKFWHITIPMLSPTILFNIVTQLIAAFQTFDAAFTLTDGGPNNATRVYIFGLYEEAFIFTNMGYASLMAWILFILIMFLTLLTLRISRSRVYYETEVK